MTSKWFSKPKREHIDARLRRLSFRSTNELVARRQRLRKRVAAALAVCFAVDGLTLGLE